MSAIRVKGYVDEKHCLSAEVPSTISPGPIDVVLVSPPADEDDAGSAWMEGIAREWAEELGDFRQDIYTLTDGKPVDDRR